jgi:hypothetical protein
MHARSSHQQKAVALTAGLSRETDAKGSFARTRQHAHKEGVVSCHTRRLRVLPSPLSLPVRLHSLLPPPLSVFVPYSVLFSLPLDFAQQMYMQVTVLTTYHSDLCKELHYEGGIFIQKLYSALKIFTTEGSHSKS